MALGAVLNSLVEPFHYTPSDATIIGVAFVVSGIIGSLIFSYILDLFQCYLFLIKVITIATTIIIGVAFYTLPAGNVIPFSINMGLYGFFTNPIVPISFSLSSEITYPISVTLAQGILLLICQIYGTGLSYFATYLIEQDYPLVVVGIVLVQFIISSILSFFLKEDLRRLKLGRENVLHMASKG